MKDYMSTCIHHHSAQNQFLAGIMMTHCCRNDEFIDILSVCGAYYTCNEFVEVLGKRWLSYLQHCLLLEQKFIMASVMNKGFAMFNLIINNIFILP
jgi:hypothetical protein